ADRSYTRTDPRHMQRYNAHLRYAPHAWMVFGAALSWREQSNHVATVEQHEHSRTLGLSATLARGERWALDLNYDYNHSFARALICYVSSAVQTPAICQTDSGQFQALSFYDVGEHFGRAVVRWQPAKRVTTNLGYSITSRDGDTLLLNP